MGLYGQGCVDREDFEEEGQLSLEGVLDLGAQAGREVGDPLAQRGLRDPVVFNLGVTFWVSPHPQLEQTAEITSKDTHVQRSKMSSVPEREPVTFRTNAVELLWLNKEGFMKGMEWHRHRGT